MSPIDVPWAVYNENLDMATGSVPLQDLGPPPEYESSPKKGTMDSIHNHYYTQYPQKPWYRRKRLFYPLIGVVLLVVITCATVLGVMLKDKPANGSTEETKASISPSSGLLTSSPGSSTTGGKQSSSPTTGKARATATPFTIADNSQLATAFAKNKDARLDRRLMIRQEDTDDLHVTEWVNGTINRYRIKEKVTSLGAEAKSGTPIALEVDSKGLAHLFFLGKTNIISYMYEKEAGKWESGEVANEQGAIRTSSSSSLSTAWHKGRNTPDLLVLAYDNPSQKLQLAITDSPADRSSWYLTDVTSVAVEPVPGQSNLPCYSLAGDWYNKAAKTDKDGFQYLLVGVLQKNEVVPWECAIDFWPPPDVQIQCRQADKAFYNANGNALTLEPPPKELIWLANPEQGKGKDDSTLNYDFILLSIDGSNLVRENWVGAGRQRTASWGFTTKSPIKAMSTTSEGLVFAMLGKEVQIYRKLGDKWDYQKLAEAQDVLLK